MEDNKVDNYIGYFEVLIKGLCKAPETIKVEKTVDEMGVLLTVKCDKLDMGVLIGKGGETARAIRHLLRVAGRQENARVSCRFNEPAGTGN